jgi:hypothetical protein
MNTTRLLPFLSILAACTPGGLDSTDRFAHLQDQIDAIDQRRFYLVEREGRAPIGLRVDDQHVWNQALRAPVRVIGIASVSFDRADCAGNVYLAAVAGDEFTATTDGRAWLTDRNRLDALTTVSYLRSPGDCVNGDPPLTWPVYRGTPTDVMVKGFAYYDVATDLR